MLSYTLKQFHYSKYVITKDQQQKNILLFQIFFLESVYT